MSFLPLCPETGRVLEIPMITLEKNTGKIVFDNNSKKIQTNIYDSSCKLQWKVDWAMDGLHLMWILKCMVKILLKVQFYQPSL